MVIVHGAKVTELNDYATEVTVLSGIVLHAFLTKLHECKLI